MLNTTAIRQDFPILHQKVHGYPLVYLDNANTTQKPTAVLESLQNYYCHNNANVHRSVYTLSERATHDYEAARKKVQQFINAQYQEEIVFVRGTTEGINLVAQCFSRLALKPDDEIIISALEHHSNIVPWQMACQQTGAKLKVIPSNVRGELELNSYIKLLTPRTRLVAIGHVSNAIGTIHPIEKMIASAHEKNIPVLIDGAQGVPHMPVDVQALDCDFYIFSGHKMYGPTGIGVVYGKKKWLEAMPPYHGGGSMIKQVSFEKTTYNDVPYKFEAGTPDISGVIGLGAAIDYLTALGMDEITRHEKILLDYATEKLSALNNLRFIGTANDKAGVISFVLKDIHPHDVGTILDTYGLAVRVGHHCSMPLMEFFSVPATVRISFGLYNSVNEVDALIDGLKAVTKIFG